MIIVIMVILAVVVLLGGIEISINTDKDWLMIIACIIALSIVVWGVWLNQSLQIETEERINLYSSHNANDISGAWILLGGRIEEKDVVYYWADNNGVLSKHHQPMDKSIFIEDGGEYLILKYRQGPENLWWLFVSDGLQSAEFHVPEGSVAQIYGFN